jgi:hypothetical protein
MIYKNLIGYIIIGIKQVLKNLVSLFKREDIIDGVMGFLFAITYILIIIFLVPLFGFALVFAVYFLGFFWFISLTIIILLCFYGYKVNKNKNKNKNK